MALLGFALALMQSAPAPDLLAITHVTVIDGADSVPRPDQTVIVRDTLWDRHVHTDVPGGREVLRLYVVNGVLSVRDLAGTWERLTQWRREIARGDLVGPRIMASGPYLEGGDILMPHLLARTSEEARSAVDSPARLGVEVVKLHGQMPPAVYFAAARAARERGLRVAGHVPRAITPAQVSDSGVGSLEHLLQIPVFCTPAESLALAPRFPIQSVLGRCSGDDMSALFARFVRNGTRIVPTLVAAYEVALWPTRDLPGDAFAGRLPDTLRKFVAQSFPMPSDIPAGADQVGLALFEKRLALVGVMHRAGVGDAGAGALLRDARFAWNHHGGEDRRPGASGGESAARHPEHAAGRGSHREWTADRPLETRGRAPSDRTSLRRW